MDIQGLKDINDIKLNNYMQLIQKEKNDKIKKEIEIHKRIKKILDKDEAIFFKIPMEDSLRILSKLISKEELKQVYSDLISGKSFQDLRKKFKL